MEGWLSPEGEFLEEVPFVGTPVRGPAVMREKLIAASEKYALRLGYAKLTLEDGILVAKGGKRSIIKEFAEKKGLWYRHDKS